MGMVYYNCVFVQTVLLEAPEPKRGRTKLVLVPYRSIQTTLICGSGLHVVLSDSASISAQIAVCDLTEPIIGIVYFQKICSFHRIFVHYGDLSVGNNFQNLLNLRKCAWKWPFLTKTMVYTKSSATFCMYDFSLACFHTGKIMICTSKLARQNKWFHWEIDCDLCIKAYRFIPCHALA